MDRALRRPSRRSWRYLNHVADRFDLRRDIQLRTPGSPRPPSTRPPARWHGRDRRGRPGHAPLRDHGHRLPVGAASIPPSTGLDDFAGDDLPHRLAGRTRASTSPASGWRVIGTGSSGIQAIPLIAEQAAHLTVFQRTPNYSVPAGNRPLDPEEQRDGVEARYAEKRRRAHRHLRRADASRTPACSALDVDPSEQRRAVYEQRWQQGGLAHVRRPFTDLLVDEEANETAREFFARQDPRDVVDDPAVAEHADPEGLPVRRQAASASTPTTTRRSTGTTSPSSTSRPTPIERDHARAGSRAGDTELRAGRPRLRHRLRRDDRRPARDRHPRPRRPHAARDVGRRPAHLPRARRRRVPEPVH